MHVARGAWSGEGEAKKGGVWGMECGACVWCVCVCVCERGVGWGDWVGAAVTFFEHVGLGGVVGGRAMHPGRALRLCGMGPAGGGSEWKPAKPVPIHFEIHTFHLV